MVSAARDFSWPLYFAKRPLQAKRIMLRRGDVFPIQNKAYLRGLAAAYGVSATDRTPFASLDYVDTLDVGTQEAAAHIIEKGLTFDQARKLVQGGATDAR